MLFQESRMFPFGEVRPGCSIVIYGAGAVGYDYYLQIKATKYCRLLYMADKNFSRMGNCLLEVDVRPPQALLETEYDCVVVAVQTKRTETEIVGELEKMGVPPGKIVCNNRAIIGSGKLRDRDAPDRYEGTAADSYWVRTSSDSWTGRVPQQSWNMPAPALHSGEHFYFDIEKARRLHPNIHGIAVVFFCGIGDYLYGTPAFEALKKKHPDLELYGYVSQNTDANNSPAVRDLLEANPCFGKAFHYDGTPCPGCWKNYDYSDALKDIPDDFLVVPFIYRYSYDSDHRISEIFDMFCLERPIVTPRPVLYPLERAKPHVTSMSERAARLASDSRGICFVQFECRSNRYKYSRINELIEKLLAEGYAVITTSQDAAVEHPNLMRLDFSVFNIVDSLELFRRVAEASPNAYFIGCNSMSWVLSGALGIPNLSVQHWRDENTFGLWFPNIMVVTPAPYSRIPAFFQYVDERGTTRNGTLWNGGNIEYFEYHPNIIWEHFQRLLGHGETEKRKVTVSPDHARRCVHETEGLRNQRELLAPLGISDYFDYQKATGRYVHTSYGIWYDEYGKMMDAALDLGGKDVLDVGCAAGAMAYAFSKQDANAYGCDINCDAVLTSPFPVRDNLYIVETSKMSAAFAGDSFDIVHSQQVFEHFPDKEYSIEVIKSMHGIAKGNAVLFLALVMGRHQTHEELLAQSLADVTHINIWPREWWKQEFERVGFIDATDLFYPILGCYQFRLPNGNMYSFYHTFRWHAFFLVKKEDAAIEKVAQTRLQTLLDRQAEFADRTLYREFVDRGEYCGENQRMLIEKYI